MRKLINKFLKSKRKNKKAAFTLVEMLVVLAVVAVLMIILVPNVTAQRERIDRQSKENISEVIATQANAYQLIEGNSSAPTLQQLLDKEYITKKQADKAKELFNISDSQPITGPLYVPGTP